MDAEVEKPKMADVLKAVRGTMLDEMESFIDELGMGDAEVCIIEAIPIPTTGNEDDDRDRLNELVAPFFITIAKALNKVVFPAFEAAFEAASKALLEDIERARGGMSVQNAVIKSAEIEIEDSGLLTAGLMKIVGVKSWAELSGKAIRVEASLTSVSAIGHIMKDEWFEPLARMGAP